MGRSFVNRWAFALVALASSVRGEVLDVTAENLATVMDGSSNVLLEFYAPWCGHCKKLAPEYDILGERFSKEKDNVIIAKVDAQEHAALAGMFDVTGYPTLKWLPEGKTTAADAKVVKAPRNADGLEKYISDKIGKKATKTPPKAPSSVVDLTLDTFNSIVMNPSKNTLVEFYAPWCGHCKALAPIYEKLGHIFKAEKDVVLAKVDAVAEKELGQRYGITGFPSLKYFPAGGGEMEAYSGGRDLKSLVEFINEKAGTSRTVDGGLTEGAGRLEALDAVLSSASSSNTPASALYKLLEEAVAAADYPVGSSAEESAGHYTRAAKKLVDKGAGYLGAEIARLESLLAGRGIATVTATKKTLFVVRGNILRSFVEAGFGEEKGKEKEEL